MNWVDEGNKFYKECELEKSIDCYQKALEIDPSNLKALYNKVYVHIILGEYQESLVTCDRLIELDRADPEAWKFKGFAHLNLKMYKEAVDSFNETINLNPDDAFAWNNKGAALCYLELLKEEKDSDSKRLEPYNTHLLTEAIESFERAFSLDPSYVNALKNKEKALSITKQEESTKGSQDISNYKILRLKPVRTQEFRSYFRLAGFSTDLGPGPVIICPVDSCNYRKKLRIKGEKCPEHGVLLIIEDSK